MDKTIIGSIITAIGAIIVAVINKWPTRGEDKTPPPETGGGLPTPVVGAIEARLRESDEVRRLFRHDNWRVVAEAAIDHLFRGTEPIDQGWKAKSSWTQVVGVYERLRREEEPAMGVIDQGGDRPSWPQLLAALQQHVPPGRVTTYGNCSRWAYGHPNGGQGIRSMLQAAALRGNQVWTNRVVSNDGAIGAADGEFGQSAQLKAEGVPFRGDNVDLDHCKAVKF